MSSIVPPGQYTKFKINFTPTLTGDISATVSIDNNDPDEGPYTFTVKGLGESAPVPDIGIKVDGVYYSDGSIYDFGEVDSSKTKEFIIENTGSGDLEITNILLTEGHQYDFTLDLSSTSFLLASAESTPFNVTYSPQDDDERWRDLVINSNDIDESPYNIRLESHD